MKFSVYHVILAGSILIIVLLAAAGHVVYSQGVPMATPAAFAEAIKQANLRAGPGLDYPQVGVIVAGTTYPLIGRNARFPWYLIALPNTLGWVYADLVNVTGDIKAVPYSEQIMQVGPASTSPASTSAPTSMTPTVVIALTLTLAPASPPSASSPALTATAPAATTPAASALAEAMDTINVRFGPGTDFPRIGSISKGQRYAILHRHALYPWLEIASPDLPGGRGWVYKPAVTITGNLADVPVTTARDFGYPTLTPTGQMVVTSIPPWVITGTPPAESDETLSKLGQDIYQYLLKQSFEPGTNQQGSVFLMDLKTGEAFSLNPGIAYSGMSLIKIPILVGLYRKLAAPPKALQAGYIGAMMVCSDNLATNAVLRLIGDGDPYLGASQVTQTMQALGLKDTFMVGPLSDDPKVTPQPISTIKTDADQTSTDPDLYNQSTPADMGWLLGSIYQCAVDGSGPLAAAFPGDFTDTECRQMIRALSTDKIGVMIEAGVPAGVAVAHKHGWINDTHGDAGVVFSSGGDYVLTIMLHGKQWLSSDTTFPIISEVSRMVYNTFNSDKPLDKIHPETVPAHCTPDADLIKALQASSLPPIH